VPHPNATYFGVDNFEVGLEAGALLAQYALRKWKSHVDCVLGVGFSEAGSFVQSRIAGRLPAMRAQLSDLPADRFIQLDGRGMREPSRQAIAGFLHARRRNERILVAAATDSSALGVLDAARDANREHDFAIVGQDCIPEALDECAPAKAPSSAPSPTRPKPTARA